MALSHDCAGFEGAGYDTVVEVVQARERRLAATWLKLVQSVHVVWWYTPVSILQHDASCQVCTWSTRGVVTLYAKAAAEKEALG